MMRSTPRSLALLLTLCLIGAAVFACETKTEPAADKGKPAADKPEADKATAEGAAAEPAAEGEAEAAEGPAEPEGVAPEGEAPAAVEVAAVEIAKDGTRFDPPLDASQVPDGTWICDMGTIHYASLEPGEGTCPICKMKLTQKGAAAPEPHGHGEGGHEHGEGGHEH